MAGDEAQDAIPSISRCAALELYPQMVALYTLSRARQLDVVNLNNPSRQPQTSTFNQFSGSNINFGQNFILTLARVGFFDTNLTRRIEWDGPEIQLEP